MAKTFYIPQKNSSRWLEQGVTIDPRYNTRPFDQRTDNNDYYQLRQTDDKEIIQLLSDYAPTLKYWLCDGIAAAYEIPFVEVVTQVASQTFKVYQAEVDFSTFTPNRNYIGYITYTNDNEQLHTWACTPIDLRLKWPNSKLFEYSSTQFLGGSDNDGIFWIDDVIFNIRLDAVLQKYQPKSTRSDYNDQDFNGSLLFGVDYIFQTLLLFNSLKLGLPDWIILKMNAIFTECNNVKISGVNYIAVEGQEFKLTRPDTGKVINGELLNEDAFVEVDVQLVPNPKFGRLTTGTTPDDNPYQIMPAPIQFTNKGASFSIANIFKGDMVLLFIYIINNGGGAFDMQMGSTLGGNDIEARIPVEATAETQVFQLHHGFKTPSTLFITVPDGINISGWIRYDNLKQPPINVNPVSVPRYSIGDWHFYSDMANFPNEFNAGTGVGIVGSDHEGCIIAGTNGYAMPPMGKNITGLTMIHDSANMGDLQSIDGTVTIAKTNLPAEGVLLFKDGNDPAPAEGSPLTPTNHANYGRSGGGASGQYFMSGGEADPNVGLSAKLGDGTPLPINVKGLKGVWFTYIGV